MSSNRPCGNHLRTATCSVPCLFRNDCWSWNNFIRPRRDKRKRYIALFMTIYEKTRKKASKEDIAASEDIEKTLSIEDIKSYRRIAISKVKAKPKPKKKSWFFGSKSDAPSQTEAEEQAAQLKAFNSLIESEQAYEDCKDQGWVKTKVGLTLEDTSVTLQEHVPKGQPKDLLFVQLSGTRADVAQRNEPGCVDVKASISSISIKMRSEDSDALQEVLCPLASSAAFKLLDLDLATKPIVPESAVRPDLRVRMNLKPTKFLVSAPGIQSVTSFFDGVDQAEALDLKGMYEDARRDIVEQGRAGLSHAVEKQQIIDLDITVAAPRVTIPAQANPTDNTLVIIADLGSLHLTSETRSNDETVVRNMSDGDLEKRAYENYNIQLTGIQVLMAKHKMLTDDDSELNQFLNAQVASSPYHIVEKITLELTFGRFLSTNTTTLAQFKVDATLPSLAVSLTDRQLGELIIFGDRIAKEFATDAPVDAPVPGQLALPAASETQTAAEGQLAGQDATGYTKDYLARKQQARLKQSLLRVADLKVVLQNISIKLLKSHPTTPSMDKRLLELTLVNVGLEGYTRKWDQNIDMFLNGIYLADLLGEQPNYMLLTLQTSREDSGTMSIESIRQKMASTIAPFISVKALVCDPASPLFEQEYSKIKMALGVESNTTELWVNQQPIARFLEEMDSFVATIHATADPELDKEVKQIDTVGAETKTRTKAQAMAATMVAAQDGTIDMKITANVKTVRVVLAVDQPIFEINVAGVSTNVSQKVGLFL